MRLSSIASLASLLWEEAGPLLLPSLASMGVLWKPGVTDGTGKGDCRACSLSV